MSRNLCNFFQQLSPNFRREVRLMKQEIFVHIERKRSDDKIDLDDPVQNCFLSLREKGYSWAYIDAILYQAITEVRAQPPC